MGGLRKLRYRLAGKYHLSSALFCNTKLAGIICPRVTSPINFNGLHNQILTLLYPSLCFTLLLVLIHASEEQRMLL